MSFFLRIVVHKLDTQRNKVSNLHMMNKTQKTNERLSELKSEALSDGFELHDIPEWRLRDAIEGDRLEVEEYGDSRGIVTVKVLGVERNWSIDDAHIILSSKY